jgi:hypothetical protein
MNIRFIEILFCVARIREDMGHVENGGIKKYDNV